MHFTLSYGKRLVLPYSEQVILIPTLTLSYIHYDMFSQKEIKSYAIIFSWLDFDFCFCVKL